VAFREHADRAGIVSVDISKGMPHELKKTEDAIRFIEEGEVCMAELLSKATVWAIAL